MQTIASTQIKISVPLHVSAEVIEAALSSIGARIVQSKPKAAKPEIVFEPVIATHKETGETREIDGVTVQKEINKIMGEIRRRQNADPHACVNFKHLSHKVPAHLVAADYMNNFCRAKNHVPAQYTNGVTA